jgi:hypothetical protein
MTTTILGTPGRYASKLQHAAFAKIVICTIGLLLAFGGGFVTLQTTGSTRIVVAIVAALAAVFSMSLLSTYKTLYAKTSSGANAEKKVAKELRRLGPHALVHGATFGSNADIDHIVLGPCLVSIETKYGRGPVSINSASKLCCGRKIMYGDPLAQAKRNASRVSKASRSVSAAVLVVVDATGPPQQINGVWVCSLRDLGAVLKTLPSVLNDKASAVRLATTLYNIGS